MTYAAPVHMLQDLAIQDGGNSPPVASPVVCHGLLKEASRCVIEIPAQIRIHHLRIAGIEQAMDLTDRVERTALWAVRILFRLKVGLKNRS